ncbi:MAG: hypothetical protein AAGF87_06615 [Bacteroidota bacterium]
MPIKSSYTIVSANPNVAFMILLSTVNFRARQPIFSTEMMEVGLKFLGPYQKRKQAHRQE